MSGRGSDIPRAPNRDKGKAPQERSLQFDMADFSPSKKRRLVDQTGRKWAGPSPNPRVSYLLLGPEEAGYATRALAPPEVDPTKPVLRFSNDYERFVFFDIPSFIDIAGLADIPSFIDIADLAASVRYKVLHEDNGVYQMAFSSISIGGGPTEVVTFSDWERIVRDYSLRAGDKVSFERYLDTSVSDDFFYMLKYVRKQLDGGKNDDGDARKEDKGKQKVSEPTKLEVDKIYADTPSMGKPVLNVIYPRIVLEKITDQEEGNVHRLAGSRYLPPHAYCLKKTLTLFEVPRGGREAKLYLSFADAVILTDNPRTGKVWPVGKYSKDIEVYDGDNKKYIMTLNHHSQVKEIEFCLGGKWNDFATNYNLNRGDEVMIYKILDSSVSKGYYHVLRHVSKKLTDVEIMNDSVRAAIGSGQRRNIPSAAEGDQGRKIPSDAAGGGRRTILEVPDSSYVPSTKYCTTKTLSPCDVSKTDPRLHLDALSEAIHLCKVPSPAPYPLGKVKKTLLVYDKDNTPYRMLLSHYDGVDGSVTYTLGGDWQKFVQVNGLRANDKITIHKFLDRNLQEQEYCYIFKKNTFH